MCEDLQIENLFDIRPLSSNTDQTTIGTAIGESFVDKVPNVVGHTSSLLCPLRMFWKHYYQPTCTGSRIGHGVGKQWPTFPLDSKTIRLPPCG
jgi:hypothetical protein